MVATAGSEGSRRARGDAVQRTMDRLYDHAATVYTLLFTSPYGVGRNLGRAQAQWGGDIAAATRARYEEMVVSTRFRTLLPEVAADIARRHRLTSHQYRVTYRPPGRRVRPAAHSGRVRAHGCRGHAHRNGNIP